MCLILLTRSTEQHLGNYKIMQLYNYTALLIIYIYVCVCVSLYHSILEKSIAYHVSEFADGTP